VAARGDLTARRRPFHGKPGFVGEQPINTSTLTQVRQRRWVRRDPPLSVWLVLLPLIGLLLLAAYAAVPFARDEIESSVRRHTRVDLDAHGYQWASLSVSGQEVTLGGARPADDDGARALDVARRAACPSWAGPLICPVHVSGQFSMAPPAPPAAPPAPAPAVAASAPAEVCEHGLAGIVAQSKIEFGTASAQIRPQSLPVLDALAKVAVDCPGVILVQGHTDSTGAPDLNQSLSDARAASVVQALIERGIAKSRLRPQGYGADRPIADNSTASGRAENRRIEFHVVAEDGPEGRD
jgi:outer membrane protein OmpA-like peptidoglycan-associated protein